MAPCIRKPEIQIKVRALPKHCEILFCDNGRGIAPELAEKVFEPLFSGREGGHGMGLTIARNIVTLHSGCIEATVDRRDRGAKIRILLPASAPVRRCTSRCALKPFRSRKSARHQTFRHIRT